MEDGGAGTSAAKRRRQRRVTRVRASARRSTQPPTTAPRKWRLARRTHAYGHRRRSVLGRRRSPSRMEGQSRTGTWLPRCRRWPCRCWPARQVKSWTPPRCASLRRCGTRRSRGPRDARVGQQADEEEEEEEEEKAAESLLLTAATCSSRCSHSEIWTYFLWFFLVFGVWALPVEFWIVGFLGDDFYGVSVFHAQLGPILDTRTCVSPRGNWKISRVLLVSGRPLLSVCLARGIQGLGFLGDCVVDVFVFSAMLGLW